MNLGYFPCCGKRASEGCRKQSVITGCRKEVKDVARWFLNDINKWKQRDFRVRDKESIQMFYC